MTRYLIFIFLVCFSFSVIGQGGLYRNYTVEDGLPSSEVYFSFQDSKGYMWFATDAGVCRFNGYDFEVFNRENGLTDNTVFRITEDAKGRIWFAPFNGRLCYYNYNEGKIIEHHFNRGDDKMKWIARLLDFYVDSEDNIWFGTKENGIVKVTPNQILYLSKFYQSELAQNKDGFFHFIQIERQYIASVFFLPKSYKKDFEKVVDGKNDTIIKNYILERGNDTLFIDVKFKNKSRVVGMEIGTYVLGKSKNIFMTGFRNTFLKQVFEEEGLKQNNYNSSFTGNFEILYGLIHENKVWVGTKGNGVHECVIDEDRLRVINHFFPKTIISSIVRDNQGGWWFTSVGNGVYYKTNDNIQLYNNEQENIYQLELDTLNKVLYVNGLEKKCTVINLLTGAEDTILFNIQTQTIGYNTRENTIVWSEVNLYEKKIQQYSKGKYSVLTSGQQYSNYFRDILVEKDSIYLVSNKGLHILSDGYEYQSKFDSEYGDIWCNAIIRKGQKIWLGTNNGLMLYEGGKIKEPFKEDLLLSTSITCLERLNDSTVLIGTKSKGLLFFKNERVENEVNTTNGLLSNLIRALHVDDQGVIWVGTTKGVSQISLEDGRINDIYNLTQKHGFVSEEITSIKSYKDTIYVGTVKGLLNLNRKKIKLNRVPPIISIIAIKVNSEVMIKDSLQLLSHTENNISIKYEGLNYRSQGAVNYQYRLLGEGLDTNWKSTQTRIAEYTLLPSGAYVFEVKAENIDGVWSLPQQISFTIHPPFWRTWWFILLMFLFFGSIVFLIVYAYFKRREKELMQEQEKVAVEKKLVELELKALRSQMNPHFIFNILNSIQHFMLNNNFKETNRYLTKFARLIRSVLNVSEKKYISIGEELAMLRLYMNLEKMRFENGFDYEIIVDEEIDEDYDEIPSMLIQPYIENAIWHGLMNKKTKGKIVVKVYLKDNSFFCTVEDNGIGVKEAAKIKAKRKNMKHKSVGMRITKDRLDIINEYDGVNVEIIDLSDVLQSQTGTRVTIQIKV